MSQKESHRVKKNKKIKLSCPSLRKSKEKKKKKKKGNA